MAHSTGALQISRPANGAPRNLRNTTRISGQYECGLAVHADVGDGIRANTGRAPPTFTHCVATTDITPAATAADATPTVFPVPVPEPTTFTAAATGTVVLGATTVALHPDTADLIDRDGTDRVLAPSSINSPTTPHRTVTRHGTCASGTGTGSDPVTLSTARAVTIRNRLVAGASTPPESPLSASAPPSPSSSTTSTTTATSSPAPPPKTAPSASPSTNHLHPNRRRDRHHAADQPHPP